MPTSAATWNQPENMMMSTGATRPTNRLFTKVPAVKPPTESSTIRPNSRGLKPMLSCSTKGTPASMPKFMAKAKPSGRMWPRKRRSRSISPEPRSRLRNVDALAAELVGLAQARQGHQEQDRAEAAHEPEGRPPARPFAQEAADGRRQRRRDVLAERDPAHDQRHFLERVGVARQRAAQHRARGRAQPLQDAQADQAADRRREGTGEAGDR